MLLTYAKLTGPGPCSDGSGEQPRLEMGVPSAIRTAMQSFLEDKAAAAEVGRRYGAPHPSP